MRRSLFVAALLGCTALTSPAQAGPAVAFIQGVVAAIGASATTAAVATAVGGAFGAGFTVGSFVFGSVAGRLLLAVGLSAIAQSLQPTPRLPQPSERLVNFAQPVMPMEWAVGTVRKGGPYAVTAFSGGRRHYGVILASHEIDGIEQFYLDQRPVEVDETGAVITAPYADANPVVELRGYLGGAGQVADAGLVAAIPEWTEDHDMAGLAYVAASARRVDQSRTLAVYGNSPPTGPAIVPVFRGARVYDPRDGQTKWSDNAALAWAWITTERLGAAVDWNDVATEADICDELVSNRAGGLQKRWALSGSFDDTTDYDTLRQQIVAACDGYIYERPDGHVGLKVGRWIEPEITLTEDDFLSLAIAEGEWGIDAPTEFVATYVEPALDWLEVPSATWVAEPGPQRIVRQEPQLYFVASHNQALRCLKRIAAASRPRYRVTAEIGMIGYELIGGRQGGSTAHRFVRVVAHGYDFVMEVAAISRGETLATLRLEGVSVEPADFAFDAAIEEPPRPVRQTPTSDDTVPAPTGLAGVAVAGPSIEWTWNDQRDDLVQQVRFRQLGSSDWNQSPDITDDGGFFAAMGLVSGAVYEAQLRNVTTARRPSTWTPSLTIEADPAAPAPGAVSSLSSALTDGDVTLSWTAPADAGFAATRVWRASYAAGHAGPFDVADADLVATVAGAPGAARELAQPGLPEGVHAWWAAAVNGSGIAGPVAGPETQDITSE